MTYLMIRSNLVTYDSQWEYKALDFSESFVVHYLKIGRYREYIELIKLVKFSSSWSFLDLDPRPYYNLIF